MSPPNWFSPAPFASDMRQTRLPCNQPMTKMCHSKVDKRPFLLVILNRLFTVTCRCGEGKCFFRRRQCAPHFCIRTVNFLGECGWNDEVFRGS